MAVAGEGGVRLSVVLADPLLGTICAGPVLPAGEAQPWIHVVNGLLGQGKIHLPVLVHKGCQQIVKSNRGDET